MESIAETLDELVRDLGSVAGGLGLFVIAFFDSSLLSLPEINDILLVYFGARFPDKAYYYALMMVLGSASGCSLLYGLARWKGYFLLRRKFSQGRIDTVFRIFRRYGALAVVVPAVLPPPMPFKIFVLSSGVLGLPYPRFISAVLAGRAVRYFGEAFLAVRYGEQAIAYLRQNSIHVLWAVLALAVGVLIVVVFHRRRRRAFDAGNSSLKPQPIEEP